MVPPDFKCGQMASSISDCNCASSGISRSRRNHLISGWRRITPLLNKAHLIKCDQTVARHTIGKGCGHHLVSRSPSYQGVLNCRKRERGAAHQYRPPELAPLEQPQEYALFYRTGRRKDPECVHHFVEQAVMQPCAEAS